MVQQSKRREADAAIALLKESSEKTAAQYWRTVYDALFKAERKAASLKQGVIKAEQRTKLPPGRTDRRRRSATRRPYGRRRGDAGPSTRGGGTESGQARNRGHGIQPQYWIRPYRSEGGNQGQHLQFHMLRPCFSAK